MIGSYLVVPVNAQGKVYYFSTLIADTELAPNSHGVYRHNMDFAQTLLDSVTSDVYAQWVVESPFPNISSENIIQIWVQV
jgi:hypothetical protein